VFRGLKRNGKLRKRFVRSVRFVVSVTVKIFGDLGFCDLEFGVLGYKPRVSGMQMKIGKGGSWWMSVGFFLMLMAPGLWVPALPNMLEERGIEWVLPFAFAVGPLASLFSPLIFGSMADYRFSAQKLLGTLSIVGAGFLVMAFVSIHLGWGAFAYLGFQTLNALIAAPMFSLLSTVTLANVEGARSRYPLFRVWGTLGWISAGLIVSFLDWDTSPVAGMAAGCVRVLLGLVCFMMPETKPQGKLELGKPSWRKNT